jgi:hypothetical protein
VRTNQNPLSGNLSRVRSGGGVRSSADNRVLVVAVVVAGVDGIALIPSLSVESAVSAERSAVLGQDVRGEEVARLVLAVGVNEVLLVELGLRLASCGAQAGVVRVGVEETHSVVSVVVLLALLDQGSVDGSLEVARGVEVLDTRGGLAAALASLGVSWVH